MSFFAFFALKKLLKESQASFSYISVMSLFERARRMSQSPRVAELLQYIVLTIGLGGLQFVWSVETGFGSLYLLSLGMQKSLVSLVWLAGPLSGLVIQPLVGVLSDNCTSRFGRRRPYIVGSTVAVIVCLAVIGWTREIAGQDNPLLVIWLAVIAFYVLDFAINSIQATMRALIVDILPPSQQDTGNAWASRMIGFGNVVGYLMGFLDLVHVFPSIGSTHLQVLTTLASLSLAATVAITCYYVTETPINRLSTLSGSYDGLRALRTLYSSFRSLPVVIKHVCRIQFFSWIGWFPFLFYNTTYVADLYVSNHRDDNGLNHEELLALGTRAGSQAMFVYALSSLGFSVVLPMVTRPSTKTLATLSVGLRQMWTISLAVFSISMLMTFFTSSVSGATWIIGICGFCWAVTIWVPFSIIGKTISGSNNTRAEYGPVDDIPMEEMADPYQPSSATNQQQVSAGTILGIHNVFIVLPQFVTALASSTIFAIFEASSDTTAEGGQHARQISWVLRLGGIASIIAVYYAWKLQR